MNILVDELPNSIEINGREYGINSDFRFCLSTILAFEDEELAFAEKQQIMFVNLFQEIPEDLQEASVRALWFLNGGKDESSAESEGMRLYSFSKDANFIFAAFRQTHGIDLQTIDYLHWWSFMALFMDLGQNTTFCELINLRRRVKTGKATKEEKAIARDMGEIFNVPEYDNRTLEEREAERQFLELVGG